MTALDNAVEAFLRQGIVKIPNALDFGSGTLLNTWREEVALGLSNTPPGLVAPTPTKKVVLSEVAPDLWALCEALLGGHDAVEDAWLTNGPVANIGPNLEQAFGWHIDGDFFRHFINSPEQGLLMIVLWTDVNVSSGPTQVILDSIGPIARALNANPEGVWQMDLPYNEIVSDSQGAAPIVGQAGDVFLMHPFVVHSASPKLDPGIRLISNPVVRRKYPFDLRDGGDCPVAQFTLSQLEGAELNVPRTQKDGWVLPPRMTR
ncbi:phytanoyl-CoA dioxygenase family protein [Sulfitobacter sp. HNIBRBA2951]|uniref:phytanoyl-CoA dioxygenase family protein n=1 Tax=Sulfitobacter aquimarinus TaxID=3158557 RepID=UPI0032DF5109